ncbi:MAG TPA: hypothetical protein VFD43_05995 [Planctomycetota bacterium]|nr:hypothetical protein [Planctomycetota bacterium]
MVRLVAVAVSSLLAPALLVAGAVAQTVSFVPPDTTLVLDPGEQQAVTVEVCLPGAELKADVYLLADVTTSMGPVLDQLKSDASRIVGTLLGTPGMDIAIGLGSYRDFFNQPFPPQPFVPQVAPTKVTQDIVDGINEWSASGGGDPPESQFYALWRLATDPTVGFRPGAKRIVVWFGDSPAHDPICPSFVAAFGGPSLALDEATLTAALQAAGPAGTTVLSIGTVTSQLVYPDAINGDPLIGGFNIDYGFACSQRGTPGQAERVATATGGSYTQLTDPAQITDAILAAVGNLVGTADVGLAVSGGIGPLVTGLVPASYEDVVLPSSPSEQACVEFVVTLQGPPCSSAASAFDGSIDVLVNGEVVAVHPVHVEQPACVVPQLALLIGPRRIDVPLPTGDPADKLLVQPTLALFAAHRGLLALDIPDSPALVGAEAFLQCILRDPEQYPEDPVKTSNGLHVVLGDHGLGTPYGAGSGMSLLLALPAAPGGTLQAAWAVLP